MKYNILIVYKSSTGFTQKYAQLAGKETGGRVVEYRKATAELMSEYDTVVFGSRAYAGRIDGYQKAKEMFQKSGAGQLVVFVTGATPNTEEQVIKDFWKQNLTDDELQKIPHFYMQSGLCYEKMSFADKLMMKGLCAMLKKKKDKSQEEQMMERMIAGSYDISSEEYVRPLISYLMR